MAAHAIDPLEMHQLYAHHLDIMKRGGAEVKAAVSEGCFTNPHGWDARAAGGAVVAECGNDLRAHVEHRLELQAADALREKTEAEKWQGLSAATYAAIEKKVLVTIHREQIAAWRAERAEFAKAQAARRKARIEQLGRSLTAARAAEEAAALGGCAPVFAPPPPPMVASHCAPEMFPAPPPPLLPHHHVSHVAHAAPAWAPPPAMMCAPPHF